MEYLINPNILQESIEFDFLKTVGQLVTEKWQYAADAFFAQ